METKFNFKSQIATSRSQSERLLALGLKKETADCFLLLVGDLGGPDLYTIRFGAPYEGWTEGVIPAWSLHRLMCLVFNSGGTRVELFEDDDAYEILIYKIEMRIKDGYFNKEYLV